MIKRSSGVESWYIYDTVRNTYNVANLILQAEDSLAEYTGTGSIIDVLSNGFKVRGTGGINASGSNYIFMAFAEHPFKLSLAR